MIEAGHKRARPDRHDLDRDVGGDAALGAGVGEGGSFRAPMATAVIGGIVVSTVLSLVVVPAFFLIMDDLQRLLSRIFADSSARRKPSPRSLRPRSWPRISVRSRRVSMRSKRSGRRFGALAGRRVSQAAR